MRISILLLGLIALNACGDADDDHADHSEEHGGTAEQAEPDDHDDDDGHRHDAPHGGALIELGEHFAHLEVKLDAATGRLDVWILDKEADKTIRLKIPSIRMAVDANRSSFLVVLDAQASELTGETVGDTARFATTSGKLKGVERFEARIPMLAVLGRSFPAVEIRYPDGNE